MFGLLLRDRDDLRALVEERAGDGETDALRGAGDDCDVLGQFQIHDACAALRVRGVRADRSGTVSILAQ
jgi:hypothetical protein